MKKNKKTIIFPITFVSLLFGFLAFNSQTSTSIEAKAESITYTSIKADLSQFKALATTSNSSFKVEEETLKVVGDWDSGFAGTNQFDTLSSSYYLKTHCYNAEQGDVDDGVVGFNIYYDNSTNLNFYLHWLKGNWEGSIAESVFLAHVDGKDRDIYQYAKLPDGDFEDNSGPFLDCWTDFGGWTTGPDRDSGKTVNMRTSGSTILLNKGFDMTLYVDRTTYKGRLVDIFQIQVDAFALDGITPKTFFTPKFAFDIFTCPKGVESEAKYAHIKPQIGFWNFNVGEVTYSNIEFGTAKVDETITSNFTIAGGDPIKAEIDNVNETISLENTNFNSSFYLANNVNLTSPRSDFQAHFEGNIDNKKDASVGYVFYYDASNFVTLYFSWDGSLNTVDGMHVAVTLNGETKNVYKGARNPWDDSNVDSKGTGYTTISEFKDLWSDYSGFVTDAEFPCGEDKNINNFRSQAYITLKSGFDMGVSRQRTVFLSRTIDEYQMYITAKGTDNIVHTWYTPLWCMDAFTYPNGASDKSTLFDALPQIGFYTNNADEVTITNLKFNGSTVQPKDPTKLVFGTRTEGDWSFTGSDYGNNWSFTDNTLSESWDDLDADTHLGEVTSFKKNENANFYMSGKLSFSSSVGAYSSIGIYPYYLDEYNYLFINVIKKEEGNQLQIYGLLDGKALGGVAYLVDTSLSNGIDDGLLIEVGLTDNTFDCYIGESIRPSYSFSFERQSFKDRKLTDAKSGFNFYNASGEIKELNIGANERINPATPNESDIPTIYQYGSQSSTGFVGYDYTLPTFVAFNCLNEAIDVVITISKEDGTLVKTLDKDVYTFSVEEEGTYVVKVNASDEWGHSATELSYKINFTKYTSPNENTSKDILWQTVVVISIFSFILLMTIFCGVLLMIKNKKEALRAVELNRKNHEKHLFDDEDE